MNEQPIQIAFSDGNILILNIALALVMFGVSLGLKVSDFTRIFKKPGAVIGGMAIQYILLPAVVTGVLLILKPSYGIALGSLLVVVSPGGNMSNFLTKISRGDVALSVTMTAIATVLAAFVTPGLFNFWSTYLGGDTTSIYQLSVVQMAKTVLLLTALPLAVGMFFTQYLTEIARKIEPYFKYGSLVIFFAFILFACIKNYSSFIQHIGLVFWLVAIINAIALAMGFWLPVAGKAGRYKSKAISIETGIKNSALSLVLVFNFWDGWGEPALVAAWWGIWHLITGFIISWWWGRKK